MKILLDEDSSRLLLRRLLVQDGHDVLDAVQENLIGKTDPKQFVHAITTGRTFLTCNHDDFEDLHDLIVASGGNHPGLPVIRKDNDHARDLSPRAVMVALRNLHRSGLPIESHFHILNHWR